jgi:hypothetical protein
LFLIKKIAACGELKKWGGNFIFSGFAAKK